MTTYKHTQVGYLMMAVSLAMVVLYLGLFKVISAESSGDLLPVSIVMALVLIILSSFFTLRVVVDEEYIRIKFGYGLFWKSFRLSDIASAKSVRNKWYYGWGIKVWFWPYMWIYNVSGFDAVEIVMKNGRIYRIGTDVPQELETTINQRINSKY